MLGPRINAGGRVGKSHTVLIYMEYYPQEVFKIATELDQFTRKDNTREMY